MELLGHWKTPTNIELVWLPCNDMLLAILEFLEAKEIEEIYLMGYSEGGYATLSTQQLIESQNNILLKALIPAEGAYNKIAFRKTILQ